MNPAYIILCLTYDLTASIPL